MTDTWRRFLNEEQDPGVVEKVHAKVSDILTTEEDIQYIAVQKKPVNYTPESVILTNRRLIVYRARLTGSSFRDHIWRDVSDVHLKEGILGSTLTVAIVGSPKAVTVEYLPKVQARKAYALAQEMEERAREERRSRDLEERRASAGTHFVHATQAEPQQTKSSDPMSKLKTLKEMLDAELISQEEYDTKKADILSNL